MADSGRIPVFTAEVQGGRCVSASLLLQLPEENNFKGASFGLLVSGCAGAFVYGPESWSWELM